MLLVSEVLGQDVMPPVGCWEQLQIAFPAVKQRLVPLAEPKGGLGYPLAPFLPPYQIIYVPQPWKLPGAFGDWWKDRRVDPWHWYHKRC